MRDALERAGRTLGLALLGLLGSAAVALALLPVTQPLQAPVYHALYLALGPSDATVAATLAHVAVIAAVAVGAPALVAHRVTGGTLDAVAVAAGVGVALAGVVVAVALLLTGAVPVELGFVLVVVVFVAAAAVARHRLDVQSGGVAALAGAMPTLVLLVALAGFGLGWGWGYVVYAEEAPRSAVNGSVADFDAVPEVRDDLFAADACSERDGRRVCLLHLRSYPRERAAVRFLARHGVRCPLTTGGGDPATFLAEHDGVVYRVGCQSHGD